MNFNIKEATVILERVPQTLEFLYLVYLANDYIVMKRKELEMHSK
uniref:Uncharacterized protein n=1 Tax=Bacillus cereus HuA4-10 TaxID=1053206 RepID=J8DS05_BACCE|nr:hypothetical protein IGC_02890 [Bacillus cereus HuA4-10]